MSLSEAAGKGKGKQENVSFRASKLTFLLKDSLAGNSKTYMVAAISPASDNVEETISTLRFASSVKQIKTVATQNKDKKDEMIDNLNDEIKKLKAALKSGGVTGDIDLSGVSLSEGTDTNALKQHLEEREKLAEDMKKSYEEQLETSKAMNEAR